MQQNFTGCTEETSKPRIAHSFPPSEKTRSVIIWKTQEQASKKQGDSHAQPAADSHLEGVRRETWLEHHQGRCRGLTTQDAAIITSLVRGRIEQLGWHEDGEQKSKTKTRASDRGDVPSSIPPPRKKLSHSTCADREIDPLSSNFTGSRQNQEFSRYQAKNARAVKNPDLAYFSGTDSGPDS